MTFWTRSILAVTLAAAALMPTPAGAGVGDLLVAPTRLVLDGRKGAEIILNNIGDEPATYRVSVEFRRMTEKGDLIEVATPSVTDKAAEDMIVYAPRKVSLAPHEPQAIRITARAPQGLPDRSEEHTSELQSRRDLVCRLLLEKKKKKMYTEETRKRRQYSN